MKQPNEWIHWMNNKYYKWKSLNELVNAAVIESNGWMKGMKWMKLINEMHAKD